MANIQILYFPMPRRNQLAAFQSNFMSCNEQGHEIRRGQPPQTKISFNTVTPAIWSTF